MIANKIWHNFQVLNKITIRGRFIAATVGIFFTLVLIGLLAYFLTRKTFHFNSLAFKLRKIQVQNYEAIISYKSFMMKELDNTNFFSTKQSDFIDTFQYKINQTNQIIEDINLSESIDDIFSPINEISSLNHKRSLLFDNIVKMVLERGFTDVGAEGRMREKIHFIEKIIMDSLSNNELKVMLLSLRRNEKDFFLRKDEKYISKVDELVKKLKIRINEEIENINKIHSDKLNKLLDDYLFLFKEIIERDRETGVYKNEGIDLLINNINAKISSLAEQIYNLIETKRDASSDKSILYISLIAVFFALILGFILYVLSLQILQNIKFVMEYAGVLSKGLIPNELSTQGNDEITAMISSLNQLGYNIRTASHFANELSNENFELPYSAASPDDILGNALIRLRNQLKEAKTQSDKNREIEQYRLWSSNGQAKFLEIMRKYNNNLSVLAQNINSELVNYLGANQGALYLIKNQDDTPYIEATSTFAYNKEKLEKAHLEIDEGLIGRCIFEKSTVYLADIPNSYLKITSGLGGANPRYLLIVPLKYENEVLGALELASFRPFEKPIIEFVEILSFNIAVGILNVKRNLQTNELLEKSIEQSEALQAQEEELRQNLEELQTTQEEMEKKEVKLKKIIKELENQDRMDLNQ